MVVLMLGTFCRHTAYSYLHQCHCFTLQVLLTLRNPAVLQNVSFHPCVPAPSCGRAAMYVCLVAASLCGVAETFFRIEFYVQKILELLILANLCLLGSWLICNCHPRWHAKICSRNKCFFLLPRHERSGSSILSLKGLTDSNLISWPLRSGFHDSRETRCCVTGTSCGM